MRMLINGLDRLVSVAVAVLVIAAAVAVCLNVFYRYVLEAGLVWADELPGFMLVWIAFLGAYLAYRDDGHIAFDAFLNKLPEMARRVALTVIDLMVGGFMVLLAVLSVRMMAVVGGRPIETLPVPQGVFMAVLPLSAGLIVLALLARIVARWRSAP